MLYTNLTLDKMPEGKYVIVWYNNINHFQNSPQDHFISFIIRNIDTNELKVIHRNIKESPAISLGSIINNKKITGEVVGQEFTRLINIPKHNEYTVIKKEEKSFYIDEPYFSFTNENIITSSEKGYKVLDRSSEQTLLKYKDTDGTIILFPSYVVAQYCYFRTASMIKQVMASKIKNHSAIEGLYKDISLDDDGNGTITLMPNAKGTDGADIFRFAVNPYANGMFHRVYHDLLKSSNHIKYLFNKREIPHTHNTGVLSAFFPFEGAALIRFRGIELLDGRILAQQIVSEDSNYPFETLTIFREHKKFNEKLLQMGKKQNKLKAKITNFMSHKHPNSVFEDVGIRSEPRTDGRLDLRDKEIDYKTLELDEEAESCKTTEDIDMRVDISSSESEYSGELDIAQANTETGAIEEPEEWNKTERPGLESFLVMLQIAQEKDSRFEYSVDDQLMLPQKPFNDKGRKKWLKALMSDNITPRAYSCAHIEFNGRNVCVIDIERDNRVEGLSVLIIAMNDNTPISEMLINDILVDFVKESGSWLKKISTNAFSHKTIKHPIDDTEELIESWAERLLKTIKSM